MPGDRQEVESRGSNDQAREGLGAAATGAEMPEDRTFGILDGLKSYCGCSKRGKVI